MNAADDPRLATKGYYSRHCQLARTKLRAFLAMTKDERENVISEMQKASGALLLSAKPGDIERGIAQVQTHTAWSQLHRECQ